MSFIISSIKLMPSCKWLLKSEVVRACLATNQVIIIKIFSVSSNVDGDTSNYTSLYLQVHEFSSTKELKEMFST